VKCRILSALPCRSMFKGPRRRRRASALDLDGRSFQTYIEVARKVATATSPRTFPALRATGTGSFSRQICQPSIRPYRLFLSTVCQQTASFGAAVPTFASPVKSHPSIEVQPYRTIQPRIPIIDRNSDDDIVEQSQRKLDSLFGFICVIFGASNLVATI